LKVLIEKEANAIGEFLLRFDSRIFRAKKSYNKSFSLLSAPEIAQQKIAFN
jgi:hypothetical protein